jgi:apolipoprotein N-acyltransferase
LSARPPGATYEPGWLLFAREVTGMNVLSDILATIGAIHANAAISIGMFLMNNLTVILVVILMGYIAYQEYRAYDHQFIQDKRKVM